MNLITLAFLLLCFPQAPDSAPSRAVANRELARGNVEVARAEFERLTARYPGDGVSWFHLAQILHRADEVDAALAAYERATSAPGIAANANYNAACLYARTGQVEHAFERLERAISNGFRSRTLLLSDPDLEPLRESPRMQELVAYLPPQRVPDPEAPVTFLEQDTEVLWVFESDTGLDRFGWQSECIGDVTGDGAAEILVGGPNSTEGARGGGKSWVLSGADGAVVRTHVGTVVGGNLGFRSKAAGDLDLDGVPDYIVTAPGGNSSDGSVPPGDAGLAFPGHVFIYSGATGEELHFLSAEGESDRFGFDAAAVADLDGDGVRELLIGAPGHDATAPDAGRVYVFSGKEGRVLRTHDGSVELERLGSAIGPLGDVDGDGFEDYVLGAPGAGSDACGLAYVHSGKSGARLHVLDPERDVPEARRMEFGRFFASAAGDLDADGVGDIYIADSFDQSAGIASGRVYLYSGATGALLYTVAGRASNDWYGIGRGLQEDYDGDGTPDLVLAALACSAGAPNAGRVDILSGRTGERVRSYTCTVPYLSLGYDAHGVGDVDGDGVGDLFITGSWGPWRPELRCRGVLVRGSRVETEGDR